MDHPGVFAFGACGFAGEYALRAGLALRFQLAGVHYRDAADGPAGAWHPGIGEREYGYGRAENHGDYGLRDFCGAAYSLLELASFRAEWVAGNSDGRLDHIFYVHR